jgi:hypothetical protein
MSETIKDFTEEYSQTLKKSKPWSYVFILLFAILILVTPALFIFFDNIETFLLVFVIVCLILLLAVSIILVKAMICPSCRKFMGRDIGSFCPLCGVRIRKKRTV